MRRIVFAVLSTITSLVLLFSYHTSTGSSGAAASSVAKSATSPTATGTASSTPSSSSSARSSSATFTGASADTRWGVVQVRITVQGGKITASEAVQYPQENGKDAEINGYALPILSQEAVQQQSASIDTVSGATVTSGGYVESLQSAIDRAHL